MAVLRIKFAIGAQRGTETPGEVKWTEFDSIRFDLCDPVYIDDNRRWLCGTHLGSIQVDR